MAPTASSDAQPAFAMQHEESAASSGAPGARGVGAGALVHANWTAPELRQILIEQRALEKPGQETDKMKGLTSLKLEELPRRRV